MTDYGVWVEDKAHARDGYSVVKRRRVDSTTATDAAEHGGGNGDDA